MIHEAREGSSESLGKLLDRYRNYLKFLASTRMSGLVRGRAGSSDVVQEVGLQACKAIGQFRGGTEQEFLAWLRAVLASRLSRLMEQHVGAERRDVRRELRVEALARDLENSSIRLEELLADRVETPSTKLIKEETLVAVADVLATLSSEYRQVICLRHLEGLSFPQVAERMNRSSGATRMLWFRAVELMRRELAERGLI
ncbi:MAG: sigma-70 family RNA polymerase sigma factor [Aureliella sp.]